MKQANKDLRHYLELMLKHRWRQIPYIKPSKQSKGFTILEVVIALAILGMGLTLTVSMFRSNNDISKKEQNLVVASLIGQKKIEEIIQKGFKNILKERKSFGHVMEFSEDGKIVYPAFRWSLDVARQNKDLLKLQLQVLWSWPENTHNISFATYLAKRG